MYRRWVLCWFFAVSVPAWAAPTPSVWFLPYRSDPDTLVLAHCDDDFAEGSAAPRLTKVRGAASCPGRFGRGFRFAAGKQSLKLTGNDKLLLRQDEAFTIEMWVRPADTKGGALWSCALRFYLFIGNRRRFGYRSSSFPIRYIDFDGLRLAPRMWSHVALTHAPDRTVRVFVNGRQVGEARHPAEGDYAKSSPALWVGSHDGWTGFLRGDVDEIRVSRRVRSFRPLLAPQFLLKGEAARLGVPVQALPSSVTGLRITIRQGDRTVFKKEFARQAAAGDLVPVDVLPAGVCLATLDFLGADGRMIGTARQSVEAAGRRFFRCTRAVRQVANAVDRSTAPELATARDVARAYLSALRAALGARDLDAADALRSGARNAALRLTNGSAEYAAALHRLARSRALPPTVRISMSWHHDPEGAFPWARRLGANELIASGAADPERLRIWKDAGYRTVWLQGLPIHDGAWLRDHPENRQRGYWVSTWVRAAGSRVRIEFRLPGWGGATYGLERDRAARTWKVVDDHGRIIPPTSWSLDPARPAVVVRKAEPGRLYRVFYTFRAKGLLDPLAPGSQRRAVRHLQETLRPLHGLLDTYWFDDIGYGYPGPNEHARWEWESYTLGAGKYQVARFEAETGIRFDPQWLVRLPSAIEAVPDTQYLAWMRWIRDRLKPFIAANAAVVRQAGMRSWLYWGDCQVGMEPYGGSAELVDELDKPAGDPVTLRALTDFPGKTMRRMRVDWLSARSGADPVAPGRFRRRWRDARPAFLRRPGVRGLYWMVFDNVAFSPVAAIRADMIETLTNISDEFRLIATTLGDARPYRHDLTVTILNSWGANYAWRPWGTTALRPFTTLPVQVRFASFREVSARGVPAGTNVVYLYGLPNTSWSGGAWWADGTLAQALERFVKDGGGLVAAQAPSALGKKWALSPLLGVEPVFGTWGAVPEDACLSASEGRRHWLVQTLDSQALQPIRNDVVRVRTTTSEAVPEAVWRDNNQREWPGLVLRRFGRGRTLYACVPLQSGLLERSLLWAAHREQDAERLVVGPTGVRVFAYPDRKLLAVDGAGGPSGGTVSATLRCDPGIFGFHDADRVVLGDLIRRTSRTVTGGQLRRGLAIDLPAGAFVLLRLEKASE
ncbi:MAG: hypothetical protein GXP31_00285 [Kiritimatiellaeota bacterium]|nr:hypothetical protein [Kiritimatiellota bacterium]